MQWADRFDVRKLAELPSPCYVIDEVAVEENCKVLAGVEKRTGCKILQAVKGFAIPSLFPVIRKYLSGTCASGLYEARLARENFGKELHTFAPVYEDDEFSGLLKISDHLVFNSLAQWQRLRHLVTESKRTISCGIRINPEYSEVAVEMWNPCARYSRFGVKAEDLRSIPEGIEGLHFHAMCGQGPDTLERLLAVVEKKFGNHLCKVEWVNFGGGHLVTAPGYDIDWLCKLIEGFQKEHGVVVYMEPGEAVVLNAGIFLTTVLDIVHNEIDIAILDTSAWAHIPEILVAPYRPAVIGGFGPNESSHRYRLASRSCLSGDIIGDYSFPEPLHRGSRIMFSDMASYAAVSNNVFNGIPLPAIATLTRTGNVRLVRRSSYEDYSSRLSDSR